MIETQRLHLRITDQPEMARLIAAEPDEEMRRAYTEMLDGCLSHPDQWPWYAVWMIELPDGTRVGDLCFKGLPPTGAVEIGYGILDEFQCRGYATEAVAAAARYDRCFVIGGAVAAAVAWAQHQPGVRCVEAETEPTNAVSQRVLAKCGFVANGQIGAEGPRFVFIGT